MRLVIFNKEGIQKHRNKGYNNNLILLVRNKTRIQVYRVLRTFNFYCCAIQVSGPASQKTGSILHAKTTVFIFIFWGGDGFTSSFPFYFLLRSESESPWGGAVWAAHSPRCFYWLDSLLVGSNTANQEFWEKVRFLLSRTWDSEVHKGRVNLISAPVFTPLFSHGIFHINCYSQTIKHGIQI